MTDTFLPDLLKGKIAFVDGGTSRLATAIANRLAQFGARVSLASPPGFENDRRETLHAGVQRLDVEPGTANAMMQAVAARAPIDIFVSSDVHSAANHLDDAGGMPSSLRRPGSVILALVAHDGAPRLAAKIVSLGRDHGAMGIRVVGIRAGLCDVDERPQGDGDDERDLCARVTLGRPGFAEEIADLAVFLASPAASYITGTIVDCDGGMLRC